MYATSQRVKPEQGSDGINSFLHMHAGEAHAAVVWDQANAEQVAANPPGEAVMSRIDISPGQNKVLSYLDVICPDATPVQEIRDAITAMKDALEVQQRPLNYSLGAVTVRFGATIGLEDASGFECDALAEGVIQLLLRYSGSTDPGQS